ncbi:MAG: hypothetical protein HC925_01080 [Coleofasciculaceae cyanobacterium SM2_3_26]|nr:hypothetical protein [Coleofasciculaceae cyanobacterium SM2_3_26]
MLSGILGKEEVTLEQLLHWLRNMLELWIALQVWQCSQSLLVPENLRLDEDRVLCLQRLYADPAGDAPPLSDLGKLWRGWFQQSDVTLVDSIAVLISDVATGELTDVDMVRSRLEEVSEELQPYTPCPKSSPLPR